MEDKQFMVFERFDGDAHANGIKMEKTSVESDRESVSFDDMLTTCMECNIKKPMRER